MKVLDTVLKTGWNVWN